MNRPVFEHIVRGMMRRLGLGLVIVVALSWHSVKAWAVRPSMGTALTSTESGGRRLVTGDDDEPGVIRHAFVGGKAKSGDDDEPYVARFSESPMKRSDSAPISPGCRWTSVIARIRGAIFCVVKIAAVRDHGELR